MVHIINSIVTRPRLITTRRKLSCLCPNANKLKSQLSDSKIVKKLQVLK